MYTHQHERERAMRDQEATETLIRMREARRHTGPHPAPVTDHCVSLVSTIRANIDNERLDDAAFREFVRRSLT